MPFYDAYCRALYRLLLRAVVQRSRHPPALVPRYGIMAKRPVISSTFLPALNDPNTRLVTTPIERITRDGVRTVDGRDHPADLLVLATGYELWTDPETYRPGTVLGRQRFRPCRVLPRPRPAQLRGHRPSAAAQPLGDRRAAGVRRVRLARLRRDHGRARCARHRRDPASRRRASPKSARMRSTGGTRRWHAAARPPTCTSPQCSPGLRTYFVNSQHDTVYHRPQTITGSRRFARRGPRCPTTSSPHRSVRTAPAPLPKEQPA